ncbi:hypothetical protein pdam_00006241 [Pocillopora damicornis]|uniref:Uncharacterized protein n=1 Tax=Pocillopora damicornis TaxID=46731 RepID=A0A3M6UQS5_POCDA|nr:hypothetical protein pdam_00006241 [Pocillopora damicornis]
MTYNKLKLNEDKRELLVMSSKFRSRSMVTSIRLGTETIQHRPFVRNLGVILDQDIASDKHIRMICKTSQYHLCNMRNIRKFSDQCSANTLRYGQFRSDSYENDEQSSASENSSSTKRIRSASDSGTEELTESQSNAGCSQNLVLTVTDPKLL